jgi:hypothetical protein
VRFKENGLGDLTDVDALVRLRHPKTRQLAISRLALDDLP